MGCGACIQPSHPQPQKPVSSTLQTLLHNYTTITTPPPHPSLSVSQCKQLQDYLASTNGQVPQISYQQQQQQQQANKNNNGQLMGDVGGSSMRPLLTHIQRLVWKVLLFGAARFQYSDVEVLGFRSDLQDLTEVVQNSYYQISLDVPRTFPTVKHLDRNALTLVLRNQVNAIPGIGYTQGMNFYAGFLLLCGFSPSESYHILIQLFIQHPFFICHNYTTTFSQVQTCNEILSKSLSTQLKQHLQNNGISEQMYSFSWFLCCFVYTLDLKASAVVWDYMVKSGINGDVGGGFTCIINISIQIVKQLDALLLQKKQIHEIFQQLRSENISRMFDGLKLQKIIKNLSNRSKSYQHSLGQQKWPKLLITNKQLQKHDKEYRKVMTNRQSYHKYINSIFCMDRKNGKIKEEIRKIEETVVEVGVPETIKVKIESNQRNS